MENETDKRVSPVELRLIWGVTRQRVHQVIQQAGLEKDSDGKVSARAALEYRASTVDEQFLHRWFADDAELSDLEPADEDVAAEEDSSPDVSSHVQNLKAAQARKAEIDAEAKEFNLDKDRGLYIRRDEVEKMAEDVSLRHRQVLEAIPKTIAPDLVGATTLEQVEKILFKAVNGALTQLRNDMEGNLEQSV